MKVFTQKLYLKIAYLVVACFAFSCTSKSTKDVASQKPTIKENKLPNIVYILCDDAGWGDFSCYGQQKFSTPHIDALASGGIRFTDHYAGSSVCAPSRSALLTGQHTGHTPVRGNKEVKPEGQVPLPRDTFNIAKMLKTKGYTTAMFGKWGLGYPNSEGAPNQQGFDEFFGYNCQRMAHTYYPMYLRHNGNKIMLNKNDKDAKGEYAHTLIHNKALEFIGENKENPFFLFLPYTIPHAEMLVPNDTVFERFKAMYPEVKPFASKKNSDPNLTQEERFIAGVYGDQTHPRAAFATMMTYLDRAVGEVMSKLEEAGLDENTIVIFSSDNGPHKEGGADPYFFNSFGPYKGVKRDLYEGGIRVPMIVNWKGHIKAGSVSDHPSAFWDVMPTLADITGAEIPAEHNIDGISFLPTLEGRDSEQKKHDYLYWEFHEKGGRLATRFGKWKGVQYHLNKPKKSKIEIYDLSADPAEANDLSAEHPELVEKVKQIFATARVESDVFKLKGAEYIDEASK